MRDALKDNDHVKLDESLQQEVQTLKSMICWEDVMRPKDAPTLHSKVLLKRKGDQTGQIQEYKA